MIRQDPLPWQIGYDDARAGRPARCRGLAYASGYVEGKRPIRREPDRPSGRTTNRATNTCRALSMLGGH